MLNTWAVLIPPVLVLICAIITHRVLPSLFLGIVSSALIVKNFNVINTVTFLAKNFWEQLYDASNLYTFAFLIVLGMLISLMSSAGGTAAYGDIIKNILKNARSAKFSSIILSILFMFDDFFSCLTVGCIMRPLTDGYKIPRAKLAFLIDSLAAPLVIIMPISTWIAMLLMQLDKSGISTNMHDSPLFIADPFVAYLHIIPFIFYSFITLFSVWFIVKHHISFGLMAQHEKIAQETGNLFGGKTPLKTTTKELTGKGALLDFIFPLASLVIGSFFAFLYSGNSTLFGGTNSFFETLKKADIFYAFFVGSVLAFIASMLLMMLRKKIVLKDLKPITQEGLDLMVGSIQILFFAWTFSSILKNDLQTGQYLAHLLIGALPAWLLPAMFFVTSLLTAIATGSSWGTIAVMVP
ncbi:MAG: Na+/H+ antiporter NhaC family protein, partial [Candidatus Babeliales bacterium]